MLGLPPAQASDVKSFDQWLDPSPSRTDDRQFKQRYVIDRTYAVGSGSPVIFVICGEADCFPNPKQVSFSSEVILAAKKFKASIVSLEHRYFGRSQPFKTLTPENLQYLKTEYAVEDLASFQRVASQWPGLGGKWIAMGGSYAGSLAACYRLAHPELIVGALASSAPVEAQADFEEYDHAVALGLGPLCLASVQAVIHQAEAAIQNPDSFAAIKQLFGASEIEEGLDFLKLIQFEAAIAVQYGHTQEFCAQVEGGAPAAGFAAAGARLLHDLGWSILQATPQGAMSVDAKAYTGGVGWRAWDYLTCTEFGFFQVAYHDSNLSAASAQMDSQYHRGVCRRLFGLDAPIRFAGTNQKFFLPLLNSSTSHILFTNGSLDPWASLSITQARENATNRNTEVFSLAGGAHCSDLDQQGKAAPEAADRFLSVAAKWLEL